MKEELYENAMLKKITDWIESGQKISEIERSGILNHGNYILWYENGKKKQHSIYKNNQLDGKWTEWHVSGIKRSEGGMKHGMMHGKWTFWYHNGQKELECNFDFGTPVVNAKIFHDSGTIKEEVSLNRAPFPFG
jgi:hypothetical protein